MLANREGVPYSEQTDEEYKTLFYLEHLATLHSKWDF